MSVQVAIRFPIAQLHTLRPQPVEHQFTENLFSVSHEPYTYENIPPFLFLKINSTTIFPSSASSFAVVHENKRTGKMKK